MKITLGKADNTAINRSPEEETFKSYDLIVNTAKGLRNPITIRCYCARRGHKLRHVSVWVNNGVGIWGGEASCMSTESAMLVAFKNANIHLGDEGRDILGSGQVERVMETLCKKLGYNGKTIIIRGS